MLIIKGVSVSGHWRHLVALFQIAVPRLKAVVGTETNRTFSGLYGALNVSFF